jgi:cysteine desulfurase
MGQDAKRAMEEARKIIADSIGAQREEIYFTSGGTEANNFALKGVIWATGKKHIVTTTIEHDCVMNSCKWLKEQGVKVTFLDVDKEGFVNPEDVRKAITKDTAIVSVIHGNNEIGTIQDIAAIGKICKEKGVYFHTDACQSHTKVDIDVNKQHLDMVTLNAHKIHGPKGIGALYIREGTNITPLLHGGGHERGLRSGTENIPGIMGFAKAVQLAKPSYREHMHKLQKKLAEGILKIEGTKLNGAPLGHKRLCNNINILFEGAEGQVVGEYLDAYKICTSVGGSACSSHSHLPSHVLSSIGLKEQECKSSIRFSLSRFNTEDEINQVLKTLPKVIENARKISRFNIKF